MPPAIFGDLVGNFLYTFLVETGMSTRHPISNWQQGHRCEEVPGRNGKSLYLYSLVKIRDRETESSLVKKSIVQMVDAAKEELLDEQLQGANPVGVFTALRVCVCVCVCVNMKLTVCALF